jgi:hypothetical protein
MALLLAGCGSLPRNGVPPELVSQATIPGMPDVRAPSSIPSPVMEADMALSYEQETPGDFPANDEGIVLYPHLALSGGGANGAFGAGFLNGWSSTGSRPTFKVVTGVSTGALMAPFISGPTRGCRTARVLHYHRLARYFRTGGNPGHHKPGAVRRGYRRYQPADQSA